MYEKIAWNSFYKTGNIESFLEYRKLNEINNMQSLRMEKGDVFSEFNKIERDNNKRDNI